MNAPFCAHLAFRGDLEGLPATSLFGYGMDSPGESSAAFVLLTVCKMHKMVIAGLRSWLRSAVKIRCYWDVTEFSRSRLLQDHRTLTCFLKTGILQPTAMRCADTFSWRYASTLYYQLRASRQVFKGSVVAWQQSNAGKARARSTFSLIKLLAAPLV